MTKMHTQPPKGAEVPTLPKNIQDSQKVPEYDHSKLRINNYNFNQTELIGTMHLNIDLQ
jgi:hypothetical protein